MCIWEGKSTNNVPFLKLYYIQENAKDVGFNGEKGFVFFSDTINKLIHRNIKVGLKPENNQYGASSMELDLV